MIRINLLGVERQKVRKTSTTFLDANQRTTFACCVIFGITVIGLGGWYWSLTRTASTLQANISAAQAETARLSKVLAEVKRAEERRAELLQRVEIIEELRKGQAVPVQMLDHVSRSMPDLLWLTAMEQKADALTIEGRTTTLISLADFVANLGTNKLFDKPLDIVNSQVEPGSSANAEKGAPELIKFSVKAPFVPPPTPPASKATPAKGAKPTPAPAPAKG